MCSRKLLLPIRSAQALFPTAPIFYSTRAFRGTPRPRRDNLSVAMTGHEYHFKINGSASNA